MIRPISFKSTYNVSINNLRGEEGLRIFEGYSNLILYRQGVDTFTMRDKSDTEDEYNGKVLRRTLVVPDEMDNEVEEFLDSSFIDFEKSPNE